MLQISNLMEIHCREIYYAQLLILELVISVNYIWNFCCCCVWYFVDYNMNHYVIFFWGWDSIYCVQNFLCVLYFVAFVVVLIVDIDVSDI